jgi:hypothetical protein
MLVKAALMAPLLVLTSCKAKDRDRMAGGKKEEARS